MNQTHNMNQTAILTTIGLLATAGLACAADFIDVSGVDTKYVADASYKLVGDTTFDYKWGGGAGDIDLNGHAFVSDTGGGNRRVLGGAITGTGSVAWSGGGVPQVCPSILSGDKPNTFKGTFTLINGVLDLDKPAGVDAIPGDLVIGTKGNAMVNLLKSNQINDASNVTLGGPEISWLNLNGHDETIASLTVNTHAVIEMGGEPATLTVGDSSACKWDLTKTVTISGFKPGKDKLVFGKNAKGLTPEQLARVGFDDPAGMLYTAKIGSNGQLAPAAPVKAVSPPFDVSPAAVKERAKLYEVPGLAGLTGKEARSRTGMTIGFFGDSITWQNGYVGMIEQGDQGWRRDQGQDHQVGQPRHQRCRRRGPHQRISKAAAIPATRLRNRLPKCSSPTRSIWPWCSSASTTSGLAKARRRITRSPCGKSSPWPRPTRPPWF